MPSFRVANGQEVPLDLVGVYKGWNSQLYDLGLPHYQMTNRTAVLRKISDLDGELDFVLIMERFEESLVLLADELCIPLHELTFISKLVRVSQSKVREGLYSLKGHKRSLLRRFSSLSYLCVKKMTEPMACLC